MGIKPSAFQTPHRTLDGHFVTFIYILLLVDDRNNELLTSGYYDTFVALHITIFNVDRSQSRRV